jgi:hypothetical protein
MTTEKMTEATTDSTAPAKPGSSPARLAVLITLLVIALGALAYDRFAAQPNCEAADKKIQEFVDEQNKKGVKDGSLVTPDKIHDLLKMQPTYVEKNEKDGYLIEYYCWWGKVPVINMRRHFIGVVYVGKENRFSSHHRERVPKEALPIIEETSPPQGQTLPPPEEMSSGKAPPAEGKAAPPDGAAPPDDAKSPSQQPKSDDDTKKASPDAPPADAAKADASPVKKDE